MNSVVTERFIECHNALRAAKRVKSSRQFAIALDYLPQSLSEILRNRRDVTVELIRKAVEVFDINPRYLFEGTGPKFLSEMSDTNDFRVLTITKGEDDKERIVHVPAPAHAAYAGKSLSQKLIEELPVFSLPDYKYQVGTHRSFDVSGDSMEPTLFEGDKVICSFLEPNQWPNAIKDSFVYVVVTKSDVLVRRLTNHLKINKTVRVQTDNTFYQAEEISMADIREIWYVRAKISPFLPSPNSIASQLRNEVQDFKAIIGEQSVLINNLQQSMNTWFNASEKK